MAVPTIPLLMPTASYDALLHFLRIWLAPPTSLGALRTPGPCPAPSHSPERQAQCLPERNTAQQTSAEGISYAVSDNASFFGSSNFPTHFISLVIYCNRQDPMPWQVWCDYRLLAPSPWTELLRATGSSLGFSREPPPTVAAMVTGRPPNAARERNLHLYRVGQRMGGYSRRFPYSFLGTHRRVRRRSWAAGCNPSPTAGSSASSRARALAAPSSGSTSSESTCTARAVS